MDSKIQMENNLVTIIYHPKDGYLEGIYKAVYVDNIKELEELYQSLSNLTNNQKVPCLIDARLNKGMSKDCRNYVASRNGDVFNAVAVIIGSPLSKITGNLFLKFSKLRNPMKLFTDQKKALGWLKNYL